MAREMYSDGGGNVLCQDCFEDAPDRGDFERAHEPEQGAVCDGCEYTVPYAGEPLDPAWQGKMVWWGGERIPASRAPGGHCEDAPCCGCCGPQAEPEVYYGEQYEPDYDDDDPYYPED